MRVSFVTPSTSCAISSPNSARISSSSTSVSSTTSCSSAAARVGSSRLQLGEDLGGAPRVVDELLARAARAGRRGPARRSAKARVEQLAVGVAGLTPRRSASSSSTRSLCCSRVDKTPSIQCTPGLGCVLTREERPMGERSDAVHASMNAAIAPPCALALRARSTACRAAERRRPASLPPRSRAIRAAAPRQAASAARASDGWLEQRAEALGLEQAPRLDARRRGRAPRRSPARAGSRRPAPSGTRDEPVAQAHVAVRRVEDPPHDELRRDGAVPVVRLQPERDVESTVAPEALELGAEAERDRASAGAHAEAQVLALADGREVAQLAALGEQRHLRVAQPERREPGELLAQLERRAPSSAAATASTYVTRPEVLLDEDAPRRARRTRARTPRRSRAGSRARPPRGGRRSARALGAGSERRRAGRTPAPSGPTPSRAPRRPAISTTGRLKRSTSREATIPITPSCQFSPATT